MNCAEALRFLERRQETRWKLGLERIEGLVTGLGRPQRGFPSIHVAGTNGKGSVCAMLDSILRASGRRVGLFTSPHLVTPRERIRIDGQPIPPQDFARILTQVRAAEREEASYFELVTAAAFLYFKECEVDIAVFETGLGGRLDATNVLRPVLSVITSIDIDHTLHLGSTTEAIAREKAGIIKPEVPCLCGAESFSAVEVFRRRARTLGSRFVSVKPRAKTVEARWRQGTQTFETDGRRYELALLGAAAARNAAFTLAAADELRRLGFAIKEEDAARGLAELTWPARFQVLPQVGGRTMILDGAHNLAAMEAFVDTWKASPWRDEATIIFGVLEDKDYAGMIRALAPYAKRVVAAQVDSRRALSPDVIAKHFQAAGVHSVETAHTPRRAIERWLASEYSVAAVLGSFYLVGSVLDRVEEVVV
ncbi:MAG: folylpolyglutamate synthase/dihydrofolate synthase family protein [Elusimicrobiota bacterium]